MWCVSYYTSHCHLQFHVRSKPGLEEEEDRFKGAWEVGWDSHEYLVARDGDHLITSFECDLCIFVKLKNRYPIATSDQDKRLAACIWRVILDTF